MCPFLDQADARCAVRLSLNKLEDALGYCGADFEDCPVYQDRLLGDGTKDGKVAEHIRAAG